MVCCRRSLGPLAILAFLGLIVSAASTASGQAERSLSPELITANELTDEQRQRIAGYIEHWVGQLLTQAESDPAATAHAQRQLTEPLRSPAGPSTTFLQAYSEPLTAGLEQALDADAAPARLNAMIVVAYMPPAPAMALIEQAVEDENPAVRYWALKGVQQVANRFQWSRNQQLQLLETLTRVLRQEQATQVVRQVMLSLVELEVRDAMERTLDALNQRADAHQETPGRSLDPEHAGLEQLFVRLLESEDAEDAENSELRELSRTAYRYLRLAAASLEQEAVPEQHVSAYYAVIGLADQILHEAHSALDAMQSPPGRVGTDVQRRDWPAVLVKADRWGAILQEPPFNFTAGELALAPAPGAGEE